MLLYWPVAGALIRIPAMRLLRRGIGPWWILLLICVPLEALSMVVFFVSVGDLLHLHGRLVQILVYSQGVSAFHAFLCQLLYMAWVALGIVDVPTKPVFRRIAEEKRKKKAAKALPVGAE